MQTIEKLISKIKARVKEKPYAVSEGLKGIMLKDSEEALKLYRICSGHKELFC